MNLKFAGYIETSYTSCVHPMGAVFEVPCCSVGADIR